MCWPAAPVSESRAPNVGIVRQASRLGTTHRHEVKKQTTRASEQTGKANCEGRNHYCAPDGLRSKNIFCAARVAARTELIRAPYYVAASLRERFPNWQSCRPHGRPSGSSIWTFKHPIGETAAPMKHGKRQMVIRRRAPEPSPSGTTHSAVAFSSSSSFCRSRWSFGTSRWYPPCCGKVEDASF